jgi:hypothetical protein
LGNKASAATGDTRQDHRVQAKNWAPSRIINAECIEWLCTKTEARSLITHRGLHLEGMRIDGNLDLEYAEIPFPICATNCVFSGEIKLERATLKALTLSTCFIKGLQAGGVHVEGELELNEGFRCRGEINLIGAVIDGALDLHGAILNNRAGCSLNANRAKIGASVFARKGFRSRGEIDLTRINIGGNLDCVEARLKNPGGETLSVSSAVVAGNILLRHTRSTGQINLRFTKVGGFISCDGASFLKPDGAAVLASAVAVRGSVYLTKNFSATGELVFRRAKIEGNFECINAHLKPAVIPDAEANTNPSLTIPTAAQGSDADSKPRVLRSLDLEQASVLAYQDDPESRPAPESLSLDGFTYERILTDKVPLSAEDRLAWLNRQCSEKFVPQPYEQLACVLQKMGHQGQARKVLIEKNKGYARFLRHHFKRQPGRPFRPFARLRSKEWWWYNSLGNLVGYGYKPWRGFYLSFAVILLGYFLFHEGYKHKLISPTHEAAYQKSVHASAKEPKKKRLSEDYPRFNSFTYSIESFIPLLKFDQASNWAPNANRGAEQCIFGWEVGKTGGFLRAYLCVHIVLGWILTSLWIGALTGLLKT